MDKEQEDQDEEQGHFEDAPEHGGTASGELDQGGREALAADRELAEAEHGPAGHDRQPAGEGGSEGAGDVGEKRVLKKRRPRRPRGAIEVQVGKRRYFCDDVEPPANGHMRLLIAGVYVWVPVVGKNVRVRQEDLPLPAPAYEAPPPERETRGMYPSLREAVNDPEADRLRREERKKRERWGAMESAGVEWK